MTCFLGARNWISVVLLVTLGTAVDPVAAASVTPESTAAVEVRRAVDSALGRYRSLTTYQDQFELKTTVIAQDGFGNDASMEENQIGSLAFVRPNQIALGVSGFALLSDGQNVWTTARDISWALGDHYTKKQIFETGALSNAITKFLGGAHMIHPVALVLSQPMATFDEVFPMVGRLTGIADQALEGRPGRIVTGKVAFTQAPFRQPVPFYAWIAEADGLLHELRIDLTDAVGPLLSARGVKVKKAEITFRLANVVANRNLANPEFAFKAGADDVEVDTIIPVAQINQPALGFTGKDMNGRPLSSKDLYGRVVLLDFWASWCGPCLTAMPQVQKLAERFADKPVSIIGINSDELDDVAKARRFVKRKGITFRQYMDTDAAVTKVYQPPGIPYSVLIDRTGVVRYTHVGLMPRFESEMARKIEDLLAASDSKK